MDSLVHWAISCCFNMLPPRIQEFRCPDYIISLRDTSAVFWTKHNKFSNTAHLLTLTALHYLLHHKIVQVLQNDLRNLPFAVSASQRRF